LYGRAVEAKWPKQLHEAGVHGQNLENPQVRRIGYVSILHVWYASHDQKTVDVCQTHERYLSLL
jgi:hypothetical protein